MDDLLDRVLDQFAAELSTILPDNNNYPPELPAILDLSTYEFEERDTDNNGGGVTGLAFVQGTSFD